MTPKKVGQMFSTLIPQEQADQAHQTHIQESGSQTALGEVVGGDLTGAGHDLPQAGEHLVPVGHTHGSHQEAQGQEGEQQLQKCAFGEVFDFFHRSHSVLKIDI